MTQEIPSAVKFLVVKVPRDEQTTEVLRILGGLGIPAEVVGSRVRVRRPGTVVLLIPADRLREAMLSLGLQGFADVRAYGREVIANASRKPRNR